MTPEQTAAFHAANNYANACFGATQAEIDSAYEGFMDSMATLLQPPPATPATTATNAPTTATPPNTTSNGTTGFPTHPSALPDDDLPGMWTHSDFTGGATDTDTDTEGPQVQVVMNQGGAALLQWLKQQLPTVAWIGVTVTQPGMIDVSTLDEPDQWIPGGSQAARPVFGTLEHLRQQNRLRVTRWHNDFQPTFLTHSHTHWTAADWSNAMQAEAGEAGNKVKKLRRIQTDLPGNRDNETSAMLAADIIEEVADMVTYGDLLVTYLMELHPEHDIPTLAEAIRDKFNKVSDRMDMPERM